MSKKIYTVYSRWIYIELIKKGFIPVQMRQNPRKPEFDCWDFEDTNEFRVALTLVSQGKKGGSRK